MKFFLDLSDGGAWPFLVGEVICLLNCVNERDLCLLIGGGDASKQLWGRWKASRLDPAFLL